MLLLIRTLVIMTIILILPTAAYGLFVLWDESDKKYKSIWVDLITLYVVLFVGLSCTGLIIGAFLG